MSDFTDFVAAPEGAVSEASVRAKFNTRVPPSLRASRDVEAARIQAEDTGPAPSPFRTVGPKGTIPDMPKGDDLDFTSFVTAPEGDSTRANGLANTRAKPQAAAVPSQALSAPGTQDFDKVSKEDVSGIISLYDLVGSIPAQVIGTARAIGSRGYGILTGATPEQQTAQDLALRNHSMEVFGNPIRKLFNLAGFGDSGQGEDQVQAAMGKAMTLLGMGGQWIEQNTNGALSAGDVQGIVDTAMAAAGGRGLKAGLTKLAKGNEDAVLTTSPQAERADTQNATRQQDPQAAAQQAQARADAAEKAATYYYNQRTGEMQPGVNPKGKGTAAKDLAIDPITGAIDEAIPEMGKELPKPSTLDSALEKVSNGQSFDMTAEERIAYKGWKDSPIPAIVDEQGQPLTQTGRSLRVPKGQLGAVDVSAFKPGPADGRGLSLEEFSALSPTLALGSLLDRSDYTLKTLERLPQNRTEFPRQMIEEQLKRPDVTDAERGAINAALEDAPAGPITAKDLVVGVKKATGDFELKAKTTDQYADYGLEGIGRKLEPDYDEEQDARGDIQHLEEQLQGRWVTDDAQQRAQAQERLDFLRKQVAGLDEMRANPPITTLYRLPANLTVSASNHFSDPNLFGWTRSFEEGGVRHVVEIQSDLAQHAKGLTGEQAAETRVLLAKAQERATRYKNYLEQRKAEYEAAAAQENLPPSQALLDKRAEMNRFQNEHRSASLEVAELQARLGENAAVNSLAPILKNWPKRLVREELAQVARQFEVEPRAKVVRFATADTVAKVEGWPKTDQAERARWETTKGVVEKEIADRQAALDSLPVDAPHDTRFQAERALASSKFDLGQAIAAIDRIPATEFSPEHQSIYDRYRRDIEKFLKQQGGTPYTDPQGHTWIEVPVPKKGPTQMFGGADPKMLARLAAIGGGAWLAAHYSDENKLLSALLGGIGGAVLSSGLKPSSAVKAMVKLAKPDTRLRINDIADLQEKTTRMAAIDVWSLQKQVERLVPKKAERVAITHAIEAGPDAVKSLPQHMQDAAKIVQDYFDSKLWEGISSDVIQSARDNYVTHLWDWSKNDKGLIAQWLDRSGGSGMATKTPYAKARSIATLADGKAQGLVPLTEDISAIMGIYGNSVSRAIANKAFVEALKHETTPAVGVAGPMKPISLVLQADVAPHSYQSVNSPSFAGMRVHPDIAPSVRMLFDTSSPGAAMKIMQGLSDTVKRVAVSFSLFHAKALTDAMIGGSSNTLKSLARLPGFIKGTDLYLKELEKGSASPMVDRAVGSGLVFSLERAGAGVEDAGQHFYQAMTGLESWLDKIVPGAGLPVKGLQAMNHAMDTFMWARLHAGMKLNMWAEKYQQLLDNSAKAGSPLTEEQAGKIAASFSNDLFGGLNWRRIAEDAKTRWGRELGQATLNPASRRVLQLLMFAPDWTISTTRAAIQAFGRPDFISPKTLAGLHQQYLLRSALYYLVVGDAINYSMSGHHLWQNKDPTLLDMDPKGERHMQWSKHTMEPIHWVMRPGQQALNKLGFLPREALDQALKVEYLSASGRMPPMKSRVEHLAKNLSPIAVQQAQQGGATAAVSGFLGAPIYGKTALQRKHDKLVRAAEKRRVK